LIKKSLCDIYVLITNAGISGRMSAKLETALKSAGVKHVIVLGATWLNDTIRENVRLRRLVPRIYGLGDLSQIIDERVYAQGHTLLEAMKDDLAKVVITSSYKKAADALDKHGFVLLIGEPAAGKTTIASLLAMGALDQWKEATMKLDTDDQVIKHWNTHDPQQFSWIDDAFGVTQYESNLVHQWNHQIAHIRAMLKNGAKIVMTSRDYIYNRARNDLKESAFPIFKESQVVIDVHDLSLVEKRQMLYNLLKWVTSLQLFANQSNRFWNISQLWIASYLKLLAA
jgi:shikimate kinase